MWCSGVAVQVERVEDGARPQEDVAEHRAREAHGDDVDELAEVPEPGRHRQRPEQAHPHVDPEAEEHRVLQRVHPRGRAARPGRAPAGATRTGRPPTAGTRPAGGRARAGGRRSRSRRIGAISGPVRPSTINSAAMSPSSRCSIMCANSSSWLAAPERGERGADHDEPRVEARLAPAGHRMAAAGPGCARAARRAGRGSPAARAGWRPPGRWRRRAGSRVSPPPSLRGRASVCQVNRPRGRSRHRPLHCRDHDPPVPPAAATRRRPGGRDARLSRAGRGARDRRPGRPADPGVAVQLGRGDRAGGVVRGALDAVDAAAAAGAAPPRAAARCRGRWSRWRA